jgi:type I restriction enzyme S subunit
VGKPAIWRDELPECCFQNTVIRIRPSLVGADYLLVLFRHFYVNGIFSQVAGGVGINHLGADKFSSIPVPLPPLGEQGRMVEDTERRLSVIDELEAVVSANLQRAMRLRQSVLQAAFSGTFSTAHHADDADGKGPMNEECINPRNPCNPRLNPVASPKRRSRSNAASR